MGKNGYGNGRAMSIPGGVVLGGIWGLIWTLIGSGLLGWLIHTEKLAEHTTGYGSMMILLSASILGSLISYRKTKRQRILVCLGAGGVYLLMLIGMTALFFGGQYTGFSVTALLIMGGSLASVFLTMEHENRKGRKGRKIRI